MGISEQIIEAKNYFQNYRLDLCVQRLNSIKQNQVQNLDEEIQIIYLNLKGNTLISNENYKKALKYAEKSYELSKKIALSEEKIHSYLLYARILMNLNEFERSSNILEEANVLIGKFPSSQNKEKKELRAALIRIKAGINYGIGEISENLRIFEEMISIYEEFEENIKLGDANSLLSSYYYYMGELDKSLKYAEKADMYFSKAEIPTMLKKMEIGNLIMFGAIYEQKGEMKNALDYTEKALNLAKEFNQPYQISTALNNLGCFYQKFADWDKSIQYFQKALNMAENSGDFSEIAEILEGLVISYLNRGDVSTAKKNFDKMLQINEKEKNKRINQLCRYCEALILRKSTRTRDLGIAQKLLKEITEEEIFYSEVTIGAMINLSEMLLFEFENSQDIEILEELGPLIEKLYKTAENQHSFFVMAQTLLLKSKIALIHLNLDEARQDLNKAQTIAEKYGLHFLAMKISTENDELIENLDNWKKMQSINVSFKERLESTQIELYIDSMLGKSKFILPEIKDEKPILIMIMAESGIPVFSKTFADEWKVNEELFGGFLTAFNSFSDEIFSKGFDRAIFGDYAILMQSLHPFMMSYIFKGQSYLAKQRFSHFCEQIKSNGLIWRELLQSRKSGRFLRAKEIPVLEKLLNDVFILKNVKI